MSRFKRIKNKSNKKSFVLIDEKIVALNKELEKTGMLSEKMTTSNVYSTSTFVPADPGGEFPIPDTTGVTGSGFTQPVSGDPDDPSNWPNAFTDNSWMRNSNTVNGEANQPIIASFDDALFQLILHLCHLEAVLNIPQEEQVSLLAIRLSECQLVI